MTARGTIKKTAVAALLLAAAQASAQEGTRQILGKDAGILPCSYWIEVRAAARDDPNDRRLAEVREWLDEVFPARNQPRLGGGPRWPSEQRIDAFCELRPDGIALSFGPMLMKEPEGEQQ